MDDREILARLSEGDSEAIRAILDTRRGWMVAVAQRTVYAPEDAEDVVHSLVARWLKSAPRTARYTNLLGFLTTAIHNHAADWVEQQERQRGRRPRSSSGQTEEPPVHPPKPIFPVLEEASVEELEDALAEAMRDPSLTRQDCLVLDTHFAQGLSREQCAAELRIPVNRLDQQLHVAKKRLNAALARVWSARDCRSAATTGLQDEKKGRT